MLVKNTFFYIIAVMSKLFKSLSALVFFLLFQICLYSQNNAPTITSITFEGLKRTKISTIEKIIRPIEVGSTYTSNTTNEIAQRLNRENIFKPFIDFEVSTNGNDVDITVLVEDRWTIIPTPMFSASNSSWYLGFFLREKNFFGYNKDFFIMAFTGSTGWFLGAWYKDSQFLGSMVDMNVYLDGGFKSLIDIDQMNDDETVRLYKNYFVQSKIDFVFGVLPRFNIGIGAKYDGFWGIEDMLLGSNTDLDVINSLGLFATLDYKFYNYKYPFEEGVAVRLNGGYQFGIADSPSYYSIFGEVNTALILNEVQRIGAGLFGGFGDLPAQLEFRVAGTMGAYLVPQTLVAVDYYTSINVFYEVSFVDLAILNREPFGRLGIQVFYEAGIYDSDVIDFSYYHGPGAAVMLYLNSIALPALEFRACYNIINDDFVFRFGTYRYL